MKSGIVYVTSLNNDLKYSDFFTEFHKQPQLSRNFGVCKFEATAVADTIREYITKHGISSLFHYSLTCDAVMHGGIHIDDIEKLILGFIGNLKGVKNLLIIDAFLYTDDPDCVALFETMVTEISSDLESVTIFTDGTRASKRDAMHDAIKKAAPNVKIQDVKTDIFHDRHWIDADRGIGVYIGTSLNGIRKKIALIDNMDSWDAKDITALALPLIESSP
jgi:hypothetical protein